MTQAATLVALVFGGLAVLLLASIVAGRAVRDHRRKRRLAYEPELEQLIADQLISGDGGGEFLTRSKYVRRCLRALGVAALTELRGVERTRLTELLERTGVVNDTIRDLRRGRCMTRRRAAQDLALIESRDAASALLSGLSDRDLDVRIGSALALAELDADRYLEVVAAAAGEAADRRFGPVQEILLALASAAPDSLQIVCLQTGSKTIERMVTEIAGRLRLYGYASMLRRELESTDDELAALAALGAGLIGDIEAFDGLAALVADDGRAATTREAAAHSLGRLEDERAVSVLEPLAESPNWGLREAAARGLANLGERGAEALSELAAHSPVARPHALSALAGTP